MDIEQFLRRWSAEQARFESMLERVTPEIRSFSPKEGYRTIGEQLAHLVAARRAIVAGLQQGEFRFAEVDSEMKEVAPEALVSLGRQTYREVQDLVKGALPEWFVERADRKHALNREEWLWEMLEHDVHHVALIGLSIRLAGGEPAPLFG